MKTVLISAALLAATLTAKAQTHTLTVKLGEFKAPSGTIFISLQAPDQKPVQRQAVPLSTKDATVVFQNVPVGTYAVRFFHDENNNRELDKGMFGVPKEEWGCSNNVKATMGPPKFEDMLFPVTTDKTIALRVN